MSSVILGLSVGNTTSTIACYREGKVEVIANPDGDRNIPSMLSYVHGDEFHGSEAKQQLIRNAPSTVAYFRDFIGVPYSSVDPTACHKSAHPVEVDGVVGFKIPEADGERFQSVDESIERNFAKVGEAAKAYVGRDIDGVVLTVPTDYSDARRTKLADLCTKAGLPVLQVINEPTAALLAHTTRLQESKAQSQTFTLPSETEHKVFVVADFGGTRSDGAVVAYNGGIFTILATLHDYELGGRLLDEAVAAHLASEFEKETKISCAGDKRAEAKLLAEAEAVRKTLSNSTSAQFGIESLCQGYDFRGTLNRLKFEVLSRSTFARFAKFVENLLAKAQIDPLHVDETLLVGGVSWTPKLASIIEAGKVNVSPATDGRATAPDELVARGAALQGSLLANFDSEEISECLQAVVTNGPHLSKAIGIIEGDNEPTVVLAAHTLLPIRRTVTVNGEAGENVRVVELTPEIVTEVKEKDAAAANDDSESDWSEDEDEEIKTLVYKPSATLAEITLAAKEKVQIAITVSHDSKLSVQARASKA